METKNRRQGEKKVAEVKTPGERKAERVLRVLLGIIQRVLVFVYGGTELAGWCYAVVNAVMTAWEMYNDGWSPVFKAQGVWGIWADIVCGCQIAMLADIARSQTQYMMASESEARADAREHRRSVAMHSGVRVIVAFGIEAFPLARRGEIAAYAILTLAIVGGIAEITRYFALVVSALRKNNREPRFLHILRRICAIIAIPICSAAQGVMLFNIGAQLTVRAKTANQYDRIVAGTIRSLILILGFAVAIVVFGRALTGLKQAFSNKQKTESDEEHKEKSE